MSDNPAKTRINLPAENWLDIFAHLPRRQLAFKVAQVSRQFAAIAALWLNDKCGKVPLRQRLLFVSEWRKAGEHCGDGPCTCTSLVDIGSRTFLPFPGDVPMPANIVDFEELIIGALMGQEKKQEVKQMLAKMKPLLSDVSIWFRYREDEIARKIHGQLMRKIFPLLRQIMPSIGRIKCVRCNTMQDLKGREDALLAHASTLFLDSLYPFDNTAMDWLLGRGQFANTADGGGDQPKMLIIETTAQEMALPPILVEFQKATSPANFFVRINRGYDFFDFDIGDNFEVRNERSGQVLKVEGYGGSDPPEVDENGDFGSDDYIPPSWLISCLPANGDADDLLDMRLEAIFWQWEERKRRIVFRPDYVWELMVDDEREEGEEEDADDGEDDGSDDDDDDYDRDDDNDAFDEENEKIAQTSNSRTP